MLSTPNKFVSCCFIECPCGLVLVGLASFMVVVVVVDVGVVVVAEVSVVVVVVVVVLLLIIVLVGSMSWFSIKLDVIVEERVPWWVRMSSARHRTSIE